MAVVLSFDSATYLAQNLDVQQAVTNGTISSAIDHYRMFGQFEGRDGFMTDGSDTITFKTSEYSSSNPDVASAVSSGAIQSHIDHFLDFGVTVSRGDDFKTVTAVFRNILKLKNILLRIFDAGRDDSVTAGDNTSGIEIVQANTVITRDHLNVHRFA